MRRAHRTAARALVAITLVSPAPLALAQSGTEVKVEKIRPSRAAHETVRFLRQNRDFIRARIDRLREVPRAGRRPADEIDPRFLAYSEMLAQILAARDSIGLATGARDREELLASIAELGRLEDRLDLLERLLADQRGRLRVLEEDFAGDPRTSLIVVVSGYPAGTDVSGVKVALESGATIEVELSDGHRASLRHGGVVQVFHGLVEPREQVVEVGLTGGAWPDGDAGFVTLEPARHRLTFLRLDLTNVRSDWGATGIRAGTWLHDASLPPGDG